MDGVVSSEGVAAAICGCNARQHEGESAAIVRDDIEDLRMKRGAVRPRALLTVIWVTARIFVAAELFGVAKTAKSTSRSHATIQSHAETLVNEHRKVTIKGLLRMLTRMAEKKSHRQPEVNFQRQAYLSPERTMR